MNRILFARLLSLLLGFAATCAHAHPVAQGGIEFLLNPDALVVRVRVSNEAVFVAAAHDPAPPAADLEAVFHAHGRYLLNHLQINADGSPLAGTVEDVHLPADRSVRGFATYTLRYAIATIPREIHAGQNLLNEITFAPGNQWEATFVATTQPAGMVVGGRTLFTHKEPLILVPPANGRTGQAPTAGSLFLEYLGHGFHHIIEGWDHLLFITALVLAASRWRDLIIIVTVFTLAHTVTLVLSVCDIVRLPSHIVEPMIAASIVVIAVQNIISPAAARRPARLWLAFGFGLFHGLGFAGGLLEAMQSLPGLPLGTALAGFSIGVELGHQIIVLPVFAVLLAIRRCQSGQPAADRFGLLALRGGSGFIGLAGLFYFVAAIRGA